MRTQVDPDTLGICARSLSAIAADLAESRRLLAAVHASCAPDLGRAGASAAHETWRAADKALSVVNDGSSALADALRLLGLVYDDLDRGAVR